MVTLYIHNISIKDEFIYMFQKVYLQVHTFYKYPLNNLNAQNSIDVPGV